MFFEPQNEGDIESLIDKYYTDNSLFFLQKNNKFRTKLIYIIENSLFKKLIYILIVLSSFLSFCKTFKSRICEYNKNHNLNYDYNKCLFKYKKEIKRDEIITKIFNIINILFSLEMIIKILAKGLIFHKYSYLRNGWNIIDFIICIYQWIKIKNDDWGNLFVFRCVKIIIIIKDITFLKGLNKLVNSIIISLPSLGQVSLFLAFIVLLFGILGIQLFSGVLYNRCRKYPIKINDNYNNTGIPYYQSIPINQKICSPENFTGTFQCPLNSYCVNFYNIIDYFELNVTIDSFLIEDEGLRNNSWLNFGLSNFDNIISSFINSFSFLTLQNWSDVLTKLLDGCSKSSTILYFNGIVIIGGFFIIKLILSAQYDAMKKVFNEENDSKLKKLKDKNSSGFVINLKNCENDINKKDGELMSLGSQISIVSPLNKNQIVNNLSLNSKKNVKFELNFNRLKSITSMNDRNTEENHLNGSNSNNFRFFFPTLSKENKYLSLKTQYNDFQNITKNKSIIKSKTNINSSKKDYDQELLNKNLSIFNKCKYKLKYMVFEDYTNSIEYIIFNTIIYVVITLNIFIMCLMKYPMSVKLSNIIYIVNLISLTIFILEIIFKIIILGFKKWFSYKFNRVDLIIVILGIYEIIYVKISKSDANSSLSSLRVIRYLKLLRFARKGGFLEKFINFFLISLRDLFYYCILLIFFLIIFAIAGIELFANAIFTYDEKDEYNYFFNTTVAPRENFNNIQNSLVTVFTIFIGDKWMKISYEYSKLYKTSSQFYFFGTIIFGNIMLLNLFLSILMNNYQKDNNISLFEIEEKKKELKKLKTSINMIENENFLSKIINKMKRFLDCCIKEEVRDIKNISKRKGIFGVAINSGETFTKKVKNMKDIIKIERTSLMLFSPTNKFRLFCSQIIQGRKFFKNIILGNIVISIIIMALDSPSEKNMNKKKLILIFDTITTFIFLLEALFKSISFGFLFNGETSYLRIEYNFIDFISLILSMIYIIFSGKILNEKSLTNNSSEMSILRLIKLLRLVRIIKLIELSKTLQASLKTFYKSCLQMLILVLIESLIILIFDIIGVNYFRGRFSRCDFLNVPKEYMSKVITKWDCMNYGGDWITPYPNFDTIKSGFILFFEMMTTEDWFKYMYFAMDATDINYQPIRDKSFRWALFFVLYMIFSFFFVFNLAIVILSSNFKKEKENIENNQFQSPIQNEFFKNFRKLLKVEIPKKKVRGDKIVKVLIDILDSVYFEVVIIVCIIANLFILTMEYPGQNKITKNYFSQLNKFISYIFIIEAVLKIYVYRFTYFQDGWNIVDFIVVCEFITTITLNKYISFLNDELETAIFKILRVGRVLKLLRSIKSIRKILNLFFNSIPGVFNVLILYFITLFIYAIIGMNLFYNLKYQNIINEKWNFNNFISSILILIRVTSGENWNMIMHEITNKRNGFFDCKYKTEMTVEELYNKHIGCGSMVGFPYFITFIILNKVMFLQFFSAVISCVMDDTYAMNLEEMKIGDINKFKNIWTFYDKQYTGFIKINQFRKFVYKIGHPLGIPSVKISDFIRVCSLLKIYTYSYKGEDYVFFYDVLIELSKYYLIHKIVEDECKSYSSKFIVKHIEEVIEYKAESIIKYLESVNEMQEEYIFQVLNPYYLNKKFLDTFRIREIHKNKDLYNSNNKLTVVYSWAIKKLSIFTKCYKCMKEKTIQVIEKQEFRMDLLNYAIAYSKKIMVDTYSENITNNYYSQMTNIEHSTIKEENSKYNNSDEESSNKNSSSIPLSSSSSYKSSSSNLNVEK